MSTCSFIICTRSSAPWPITSNSWSNVPAPGDPGHRCDAVGHEDRVPEGDDRRRAQPDLVGHTGEVCERDERLDEGTVRALHPVRVEHEMVAHPQGIEPEALCQPRSVDEQVLIRLEAEMGH